MRAFLRRAVLGIFLLSLSGKAFSAVFINELLWAGSDLSTADEWVELYADADTDVSGWILTSVNSSGEEVAIVRFSTGTIIGSNQYFLIANNDAANSRLARDADVITKSLTLPNTKLLIRLKDQSGTIIDLADDGVGVPFAGANASGTGTRASMERILYGLGNIKEHWATAQGFLGFDDAAPMRGTPGFPNGGVVISSSSQSSSALSDSSVLSSLSSESSKTTSSDSSESSDSSDSISSSESSMAFGQSSESFSYSSITVDPLPKLIITEILSNPKGVDTLEWIEVQNVGSGAIDLQGMKLADNSNTFIIQSGALLEAGNFRSFRKNETGLSLDNGGETITLLSGSMVFDALMYPETAEEVSFGRDPADPNLLLPFCVPSEGQPNSIKGLPVTIMIQSGQPEGAGKVTLNVRAETLSGSLASATCSWDFGDGFLSTSCNPPSHTFSTVGDYLITLSVKDYCSTTVVQTLPILVLPKGSAKKVIPDSPPPVDPAVPVVDLCGVDHGEQILISEFIPDPLGDETAEEWIELKNMMPISINLCGWVLDDSEEGSKAHVLKDFPIAAGAFAVLRRPETGIALNNDGDSVRLISPSGRIADEEVFDRALAGESYALRSDGNFVWTPFHTPGSDNRFRTAERRFPTDIVIISAALPNPSGVDKGAEWIELTNVSDDSVTLSDWSLDNAEGGSKPFRLHGIQLSSKETRRFGMAETGLELRNSQDSARLLDPDGNVVSFLSWTEAEDGRIYRPYAFSSERVKAVVTRVVDGDTFDMMLTDIEHLDRIPEELRRRWLAQEDTENPAISVRMIGIDTPETVHPKKAVEKYGLEASNYVRSLIEGKNIELEFDTEMWDKYQRLLAYVYIDGALVQAKILQNGLGFAYLRFPFIRAQEFLAYEAEARKAKLGLWSSPEMVEEVLLLSDEIKEEILFEKEGLHIAFDPKPGVVASGSTVKIKMSQPSQVYLSINSGFFLSFTGAFIVRENISVSVYAEAHYGSGELLRSETIAGRYTVPITYETGSLIISEVYPSPLKDEVEWVEIENRTAKDIVLADWFLDDVLEKGSKRWKIPADKIICAHGFLALTGETWKLAFNNDGDDVHLLLPDGRSAASLTYPKFKKGMAYARIPFSASGALHCVTATATPGSVNIFVDPIVLAKASAKKSSTSKNPKVKSAVSKTSKMKLKKQPVRYKNVLSSAEEPELPAIPEKLLRLKALVGGESARGAERPVELWLKHEFLAFAIALSILTELLFRPLTAVFQKRAI